MSKRIPIFIGFILLALAIWLQITSVEFVRLLQVRLNNIAYDMQLRATLFAHFVPPTSPVAIVDVDDKSLQAIGRWPWPRSKIAALIQRLQEEGTIVVAMDMMFPEKEDDITDMILQELNKRKLNNPSIDSILKQIQPEFDNDAKLANSFAQKDIVIGMTLLPRPEFSGVLPPPVLTLTPEERQLGFIRSEGFLSNIAVIQSAGKHAGFINVYADPDGVIRRVPILMRYKDEIYPSLAFEAVRLYLLSNVKLITAKYHKSMQLEGVQLGSHRIPTDAKAQMLIPFRGRSYSFPYYSAIDVFNKKLPPNALAGKIVFLGTSATGLGDIRATAIQSAFPGVEIQATIADGILDDHFSYRPAWTAGAEISITALLGFVLILLFPYLGPRGLITFAIIIPALLMYANSFLWEKTGLIIFVLIPILLVLLLAVMNMVYGYLFESRRRERLKEMFGQYVPSKHIDNMLKESGNFGLLGDDREMTVLFADIRNFTTISEPMTATELKDMLNQFFTPMTEIIFNFQGTIDKYIGDLIMAFWGAPMSDPQHAEHALAAALDMQVAVDKLKPIFKERGWAEVNIGIGLNSGVMSVGDMGSQFRRNYTVLGDAVNLGSRVESLTKYYGVKIMTTENTKKDQTKYLFRQLDRVRVKGKKLGVAIFEVVCRETEASDELKKQIALSDIASNLYFEQKWEEAERLFNELHAANPDVKIYSLYLERIADFKQTPPPQDWDGVYEHASK